MDPTKIPFDGTIPPEFKHLRVSVLGWPIPWFVHGHGGFPDFRVTSRLKIEEAIKYRRCWICGLYMKAGPMAFVLGCMCVVNRLSAEPPAHQACAERSAEICPFLNQTMARRRNGGELPEGTVEAPGIALLRQPHVTVIWRTRSYEIEEQDNGPLFRIGDPIDVKWFHRGRAATRAEILHAIDTGLPALREMAAAEGDRSMLLLEEAHRAALTLVPAS